MLKIQDKMKANRIYQDSVQRIKFDFPAPSTWIVMTDSTSHAALSGQYLFEQTFSLPATAMQDEFQSPLRMLETLIGKSLV